jgi:glutathione S-transferase
MAADPLDTLRLTLMQDVLPVGLAMVERVRKGGPQQVMAAFDGSTPDPLDQLRQEGETAASQVREQLDRVSPGLGNPVMKVEVRDVQPVPSPHDPAADDPAELQARLAAIAERLTLLEQRLAPPPEAG